MAFDQLSCLQRDVNQLRGQEGATVQERVLAAYVSVFSKSRRTRQPCTVRCFKIRVWTRQPHSMQVCLLALRLSSQPPRYRLFLIRSSMQRVMITPNRVRVTAHWIAMQGDRKSDAGSTQQP